MEKARPRALARPAYSAGTQYLQCNVYHDDIWISPQLYLRLKLKLPTSDNDYLFYLVISVGSEQMYAAAGRFERNRPHGHCLS
jgi:hypothetical protein